jgi:RNA polymerase sigma-70 factor, ECF subfamily
MVRGLTVDAFQSFIDDAAVDPAGLRERAGDLYLAAAAAENDNDAIRVFDQELLRDLPRWLVRLRLSADSVEEVRQRLRAKLLVGPPPRLKQYRASGPLAAWVRMASVRVALDMFNDDPIAIDLPVVQPLVSALDLERRFMRQEYGQVFERTLRDAIGELSKRDRNLLRCHYLAAMSLDAIARTYHVHRATVVRWLAAIRNELDEAVRIKLWQQLGISPSDFRSLWNAVRSDIDVSLSRLLIGE